MPVRACGCGGGESQTWKTHSYYCTWYTHTHTHTLQSYHPTRTLRSTSSNLLVVPRTRLKMLAHRSFQYTATTLQNQRPDILRHCSFLSYFKSCLKTQLYSVAFSEFVMADQLIFNFFHLFILCAAPQNNTSECGALWIKYYYYYYYYLQFGSDLRSKLIVRKAFL